MSKRYITLLFFACMILASSNSHGKRDEEKRIPAKTFSLSFENGLKADFAVGNPEPIQSTNVTVVEGIIGNGGRIPNDGCLLYDLERNFSKERGTLMFWGKPGWSSSGRHRWARGDWHGLFSTAKNGSVPNGPPPDGTMLRAMQESMFLYSWYGSDSKNRRLEETAWNMYKQSPFVAGGWKHYAFTWDSQKGIQFYLNAKLLAKSKPMKMSLGDANNFYVGSAFFNGKVRGFNGIIDEVAIFDDVLSSSQIKAICGDRTKPITVELMDYAMFAEKKNTVRLKYHNNSSESAQGTFLIELKDLSNNIVEETRQKVQITSNITLTKTCVLTPPKPGQYELIVSLDQEPICHFRVVAISPEPQYASIPITPDGAVKETLLETIDCAKEYGEDKYRDDGKCKVEKSDIGSWRLAYGGKKLSGFIYKLDPIKNLGKPYFLEIEYPDNAQRAFYVAVFPERNGRLLDYSQDTIGVITGGLHPTTNTMQKKRLLFWPDDKNLVVGCYVHTPYEGEQGAVLSKIRLYEVDGSLPKLKINTPTIKPERMIGVWIEDPTMTMQSWFNHCDDDGGPLPFWQTKWDRITSYLNYTGQNMWCMQVFDYYGDRNTLPESLPQAKDTTQRTEGWADLGALTLKREDVDFFVLMHDMTTQMYQGTPAGLGKLVGTENLSKSYNEALAKGGEAIERFNNKDEYCELCRIDYRKGSGAALEPLHPKVQEAFLRAVRQYGEKFAVYDNFKGIGFIVSFWSNFYYQGIDEGYGDYPVMAFEKETGINVPIDTKDPKRFSKRYEWLMSNAKEKWIQWRIRHMIQFYKKLAKTLTEVAPGRKILLMPFPMPSDRKNFAEWPSVESNLKSFWKGRGIDFEALSTIDGFEFMPSIDPNWERTGLDLISRYKNWNRNGNYYSFSPELSDLYKHDDKHAVFVMHQSTYETYPNFSQEQVKSYFYPRKAASGRSPKCHIAFSMPYPDNQFVLEHMTRLVADFNPEIISHGWWSNPDNGAIRTFQKFYQAYRAIPMLPFKKVPNACDPVQIKYAENAKKGYILIVNREYYPVTLSVSVGMKSNSLINMIDKEIFKLLDNRLEMKLKPYQILCLKSDGPVIVGKVSMTIPSEIAGMLTKKLQSLKQAKKVYERKKLRIAGLAKVIELADEALRNKHYSRLYRLMLTGPANEALRHQSTFRK